MGAKYHVSSNGNVEICRAKVRPCPLGGGHFDSVEAAEQYLENKYQIIEKYEANATYGEKFKAIDANKRGEFVARETQQAILDGMSTDKLYKDKKTNEWLPERKIMHENLLNELMNKYKDIPSDKKVVFSAGLPGAGKTTVLTQYENLDVDKWATISSDDFKEMLAERGYVPEIEGLTPMESSTLVHKESSYLADELLKRLSSQGKNLIYDFTCRDERRTKARIGKLTNQGYKTKDMQFIFVNIPIETAKERAKYRYLMGLNRGIENDYNNYQLEFEGKDDKKTRTLGGRYLPESVIDNLKPKGTIHDSVNAEVLIKLHEDSELNLPRPKIYDNSGTEPVEKAYSDFLIGRL